MNRYALLCLENNPILSEQIRLELSSFASKFDIHSVESIHDAHQALDYIKSQQQSVALVIASHHEQFNGADFLIALDKNTHTQQARKILISDSNNLTAILNAVNEGRLDHCLTKPVQNSVLHQTILKELTTFILNSDESDLLEYSYILDQQRILRSHIDKQLHNYRVGFIHNYHSMSDTDLAEKVIAALHDFFAEKDEDRACRTYSTDHLLTSEGEPNRFLWFITEGQVALYKKDEQGVQREVVLHDKGNIVGGMSFVTGDIAFSTAITTCKTKVIKLDQNSFTKVMHSNNQLLPLFTNLLLRHFNRRLQRSINTKITLQETLESLEVAHQQLIEKEKMAILGQLVAGVAHELNNPIAAILRSAETLTTVLHDIVKHPTSSALHKQAIMQLDHALNANPISTIALREQTKTIQPLVKNRMMAKKITQLGLHDNREFMQQLKHQHSEALHNVQKLEKFHITGSTLRSIAVCAQRIADMVKSLKGYTRSDDESQHTVDIHEGIEDTLVIFENKLKRHTVIKEYHADEPVLCQPIALQQVWTNLVSNALDALPAKGTLLIRTESMIKQWQHYIVITFRDNGHGMSKEVQEKIFELNYTTKKEGDFGLGIGLSVCQQIIHSHQGWLDVTSKENEFTQIQVWLPVTPSHPLPYERSVIKKKTTKEFFT